MKLNDLNHIKYSCFVNQKQKLIIKKSLTRRDFLSDLNFILVKEYIAMMYFAAVYVHPPQPPDPVFYLHVPLQS